MHHRSLDFYLQWLYFQEGYLKGYLCDCGFAGGDSRESHSYPLPVVTVGEGILDAKCCGFPFTWAFPAPHICASGFLASLFPDSPRFHLHSPSQTLRQYKMPLTCVDNLILPSTLLLILLFPYCGWIDQTILGGKWLLWWDCCLGYSSWRPLLLSENPHLRLLTSLTVLWWRSPRSPSLLCWCLLPVEHTSLCMWMCAHMLWHACKPLLHENCSWTQISEKQCFILLHGVSFY